MDELELVKAQLARLPTRRDQAFTPLRIMFGSAILSAALVILWLEASGGITFKAPANTRRCTDER